LAVCHLPFSPVSALRPSRSATSAEITTIVAPVSTSIVTGWPAISASTEYWPPGSAARAAFAEAALGLRRPLRRRLNGGDAVPRRGRRAGLQHRQKLGGEQRKRDGGLANTTALFEHGRDLRGVL